MAMVGQIKFGWCSEDFVSGTRFLPGHLGDSDKNVAERASKNIARHFLFQGGRVMSATCRPDFFFASTLFPKLQPVGKLL